MCAKFTLSPIALLVSAVIMSPWAMAADSSESATTKVKEADKSQVDEVIEVKGDGERRDGYRPRTVDMGPLGTRALLDTPYSVSVFNKELIESVGATSLDDILKYMPSSQMEARGGTDVGRPQSRGMQGSVVANNHLDGLNVVATTAQPIELYDRVEVINGLTGAFYGPASPAGTFNYVLKRPTQEYYTALSTEINNDGAWTLHADTGGSPSQYFGYRVNVLQQEGDGYADGSHLNRKLGGVALDVHPGENTVIELNGSYYRFDKFGYPGGFSYASTVALPNAMDSTKAGYGQSFAGSKLTTETESARIKHQLSDNWKFTGGVLFQKAERALATVSNTLTGNDTFISRITPSGAASKFEVTSNMANLTGKFNTGSINHEVVVGTTGYKWDIFQASVRGTSVTLGTSDLSDPQVYDSPGIELDNPYYKSSTTKVQSGILGDTITWNEYLSTMLMGSYSDFDVKDYLKSGSLSDSYSKDGLSSTVAMIYKPVRNISLYAAYADSLEEGGSASSDAVNAGETLDPVRSHQTELGVKANLGGFDVNAALFQIKRPMAYEDGTGYYRSQGLQRNNGIELTINGNLTEALKIFGGMTYLDAELKDAYDVSTSGKDVVGVPEWQGNLLAEYAIAALPGVSLTANLHYTGKRAANNINTTWADAYTTLDLGAKYHTEHFYGKDLTVRLNATNVTDEKYWAAIFPGNIYGTPGASNTAFLGEPMEIRLSATVQF